MMMKKLEVKKKIMMMVMMMIIGVVVKVKGIVEDVPGHSMVVRIILPSCPQMAIRQAPSPSVVL